MSKDEKRKANKGTLKRSFALEHARQSPKNQIASNNFR